MKEQKVELTLQQAESIFNYMGTRPYNEVAGGMAFLANAIQQAKIAQQVQPSEPAPAPVKEDA